MSDSSYRASLRSSTIIGGAQVFTILASLAKMKVVAVVLGPMGVGLIGLYMNLVSTAGAIASLGIGTTGVRQVVAADADGGEFGVGRARRVLFWGSMALALTGGGLFWLSSNWIARVVLSDEARSGDVAWLSIGVAVTVAASSQAALLTGLRRIGDLARINVGAGVIGALIGVLAIWIWPAYGLVVMVIIAPTMSFVLGRLYIARLGRPAGARPRFSEMTREWRAMARLGAAFMMSGVVVLLGQLAVRTLVQRELGSDALGQFQAAWSISVTYLGFVLGAMATDYFPRLTAALKDRNAAVKLVNEQTEVALLLCAPVVLAMLAFSPWVIRVLYSSEFGPAVEILQWQLLGDILKVISWPLGFLQQARGAGKTFLATETAASVLLILVIIVALPKFGLQATGIAFLAVYVLYLPLVWWLGRRWIGFRWTRSVRLQAVGVVFAALAVDLACRKSDIAGAIFGGAVCGFVAVWALIRLSSLANVGGLLGKIVVLARKAAWWTLRRR